MGSPIITSVTIGAEEEFHLVDRRTRQLASRAPELLAELSEEGFVGELQRCVIESNSQVVTTLDDLRKELMTERARLARAAERVGAGIVAAGSVPLVEVAALGITDDARY